MSTYAFIYEFLLDICLIKLPNKSMTKFEYHFLIISSSR